MKKPSDQYSRTFSTPMMQQYIEIKKQHRDAMLFFRLGDFYELFLDDAELGAKVLGITLTARPRGKDGEIPMAGIPFHAAETYIAKLIQAGHKVAICEQTSEPDKKGIVEREVVRVITPGTYMDTSYMAHKEHNYICCVLRRKKHYSLAAIDISTGDFICHDLSQKDITKLQAFILEYEPKEIIVSAKDYGDPSWLGLLKKLYPSTTLYPFAGIVDKEARAKKLLCEHFGIKSLISFGVSDTAQGLPAAASVLAYVQDTQRSVIEHVTSIRGVMDAQALQMDASTVKNLELFANLQDGGKAGTLLEVIDNTVTAAGGRLLRTWLKRPLQNLDLIEERQHAISLLLHKSDQRESLQQLLKEVDDIERLLARLSIKLGNPKDVIRLRNSLQVVDRISKQTSQLTSDVLLSKIHNNLNEDAQSIAEEITATMQDEVPTDPKKGMFVKDGIDTNLDELRTTIRTSQKWIASYETDLRNETGIGSLKIKFNKVFGFYIEVSKANLHAVLPSFERKQTMVNAERFVTPELKEHEHIILSHESKSQALELEIFTKLLQDILSKTKVLQKLANTLAQLDCLCSMAELASVKNLVRPQLHVNSETNISKGRHLVVEEYLQDTSFVPNDTVLNDVDHQLIIITGPNMAGKSVYMRQVAVITILAHMGCYVPAEKASISITDQVFVRSGAGDVISGGLSTFMVEMVETANILHHGTEKSLVIMDEIGRGTTTYDGISIAWAVASYLVNNIKAKSLFATHYHELQALEEKYPQSIRNYHAAVEEHNSKPVFLHRIKKGGAAHSYGVAVAKLAGIPEQVSIEAEQVLSEIEAKPVMMGISNVQYVETNLNLKSNHSEQSEESKPESHSELETLLCRAESNEPANELNESIQSLIQNLKQKNLAAITPLEAMNYLAELQNQLK